MRTFTAPALYLWHAVRLATLHRFFRPEMIIKHLCSTIVCLLVFCSGVTFGQEQPPQSRIVHTLIWSDDIDLDGQGGFIAGGVYEGRWIKPERLKHRVVPGMTFRLFDNLTMLGAHEVLDTSATTYCGMHAVSFAGTDSMFFEYALAAPWNPIPKRLDTITQVPPEAWRLLQEVLRQKGLSNPLPGSVSILSVDIDNDGVLDRVITSNRNNPPSHGRLPGEVGRGDHSIVLVTNASYDNAATRIVDGQVYEGSRKKLSRMSYIERSVACLLDADGDGTMEIAIRTREDSGNEEYDDVHFQFALYKIQPGGVTVLHAQDVTCY